jgi:hypothetical protein
VPTGGAPEVAPGIESVAIHPAAPWRHAVGDTDAGTLYRAAFATTVQLRFDDTKLGGDVVETWEAVILDPDLTADGSIVEVDFDDRDFIAPDPDLPVAAVNAPISQPKFFEDLEKALRDHLDRSETLDLFRNRKLKVVSRPGETEAAFISRCQQAANDIADVEKAEVTTKYQTRLKRVRRAYDDAVADATLAEQAADDEKQSALLGFGLDLLTGRRARIPSSRTRTATNRARRAQSRIETKRAEYEDLMEDLEDAVAAIDEKWDANVQEIESINIGLESDDIRVMNTKVVWIRTT